MSGRDRGGREKRIAAEISELLSQSGCAGLDLELKTGKAIINGLYDGEISSWRNPRKSHPSLRTISELLGGRRHPPQLYYATCAYVLSETHPDVIRLEHVKRSHWRAVAGLSDDVAYQLLTRASREKQLASALRKAAAPLREPSRGGRRAIPEEVRLLWKGTRLGLELPSEDAELAPQLERLTDEERSRMVKGLRYTSKRCGELAAEVETCIAGNGVGSRDEGLRGKAT
jgi:hypothetical protein